MKVFAHFDSKGAIGGLVVVEEDQSDGALDPPLPHAAPGYNTAELDSASLAEIKSLIAQPDKKRFLEFRERFVVEAQPKKLATLAARGKTGN